MEGQYNKEKLKAQIQMQSKEQLQNQKYGNFTMATVLSTAEELASGLSSRPHRRTLRVA